VLFPSQEQSLFARRILKEAERYYKDIAEEIGYTRYGNFWTWDDRARIILFPDKASFIETTGQPGWSTGFAGRDALLFSSRTIVTYPQEEEFFDGVLPHEISHLIMADFLGGQQNIPVWLDEGVAQLQEKHKSEIARAMMQILVPGRRHVPFVTMMYWDISRETDNAKVKIFYTQSLSMVEFMIKRYGSSAFGRLCRLMRDGRNFEEALRVSYSNRVASIADLEEQWIKSIYP